MTWLEWVGVAAIAVFAPVGALLVFGLFIEWWAGRRDLRKALFGYYAKRLKRENRRTPA